MKQAFEPSNDNIQSLADRLEISNLLLDLAAAIDTNAAAARDDVLAANALIPQSRLQNCSGQHQISNADIHIAGDTATARTLCYRSGGLATQAFYYVDKFQRTAEGWRIVERAALEKACD